MRPVKKTKERCKDAARVRRERERLEFEELAKLLPLPSATTSQLDKASIIRLTSSYLRMRQAFPKGLGANWGSKEIRSPGTNQVREIGSLLLQTIEGFVFALQSDGKIMYISETASVHLGLPQMDLTGSSVFEFVHPADHEDLRRVMRLSDRERADCGCELARSFCVRMKCILPKRNAGLAIANFKAIHCTGYLKLRPTPKGSPQWDSYALVAVGHSLLPSASTEFKLTDGSFMFKASLDLRFYYIEAQIVQLLGFDSSEMVGASLYQFVHAADLDCLRSSHKTLLDKGQAVTKYYRLMKQSGGFVWIQSYITVIYYPRHLPKPQNIVSINMVIADEQLDSSCASFERPVDLKGYLPLGFVPPQATNPTPLKLSQGTSLLVAARQQQQTPRRPTSAAPTRPRQRRQTPETGRKYAKLKACTGTKGTANGDNSHHDYQLDEPPLLIPTNAISLRRTSDDTCSVVSSLASTSGCSFTSSLSHHNSDYTTGDGYGSAATTTVNELTYQLHCSPQQESTTSTNTATTNSGDYENYLIYCQPQPDLDGKPQVAWPEQQTNEMEQLAYNQLDTFNSITTNSPSSYNNNGTRCLYLRSEPEMVQISSDNGHQQSELVIDTRHSSGCLDGSSYGSGDEQLILLSASNATSYLNQQPQYFESPTSYSTSSEPIMAGCSTCIPHRHQHQVPIDSGYTLSSL